MNKTNILKLFSGAAAAGVMAYAGMAMAEDASALQKASDSIKKKLEQAVKDSEECDRVYWASLPVEEKRQNVLVCDEQSDGQYIPLWRINLEEACDVRLQENYRWYVFEWLGGDDVITSTKNGEVISTRFWDKDAEKIYQTLNEYIEKNVPQEEREKCNQRYATGRLTAAVSSISYQSKESCEERQKRTGEQLSQLLQTEFDHVKIDVVPSDEPPCFKDLIVNCYNDRAETSLEPLLVWRFNFDRASCLAKRMKKPLFGFIDDYIDIGSNHLRNPEIGRRLEEISAAYVPNGKKCGGN